MRLLYMMPSFARPSETWTVRMLEYVREETALVVAGNTRGASELLGVPVMECFALRKGTMVLQRFPALWPWLYRYDEIERRARAAGVTHVLCHFGQFAQFYVPLWRRLGLKAFVHFHGVDASWDMRANEPPHRLVHPPSYLGRIREMADVAFLIANSHHTAARFRAIGLPEERVRVKHLGVAIPERVREHTDRRPVRVVAVGRLQDCKAPERTIAAFGIAVGSGLDAVLDVVGEGPMRSACEAEIAKLPDPSRVRLLGARPFEEVDALLEQADVFTQHNVTGPVTGQIEAFGVSVIEAMARGVPVAVASSGGVTETVPDASVGVLFEPGDIQAQAQALLRLGESAELRNKMAASARDHVRAHFSQEVERRRLREILEEA